ncbi:hypothetical protein Pan153_18650 [Gimesia panareensis]|uniref:DUF5655 domain-containing protein n=1 Tax=Gimesia panareensis TaxID=2527978 RepID=A0A518FLM9_9PLAN|nr:hypothetical protein [Gimesia panareensis]QDV17230.1 hypothetical protein Pan153_18650 [Gimesia panareensis]
MEPTPLPIASTLSIRECGYNEYWLQDQIYENPGCLGLGELDAIDKERRQSSGGRLDLLMKNAEDDAMYEVEIMLGDTDESHIIRTIEYWDNEKRRWPQRQHTAVLVAESITRRFFNVIHLLSHSIPIIAIQATIIEVGGVRSLHFTKVLDTYEEIDDGAAPDNKTYDLSYWKERASWVIENAKALQEVSEEILEHSELNYTKHYIAITLNSNSYCFLHKRSDGKSLFEFRIPDHLLEEAKELLDSISITYISKSKRLRFTSDKKTIEQHKDVFKKLTAISGEYWAAS